MRIELSRHDSLAFAIEGPDEGPMEVVDVAPWAKDFARAWMHHADSMTFGDTGILSITGLETASTAWKRALLASRYGLMASMSTSSRESVVSENQVAAVQVAVDDLGLDPQVRQEDMSVADLIRTQRYRNAAKEAAYAEKLKHGWPQDLPPIVATRGADAKTRVLDGHHRLAGAIMAKLDRVPVLLMDESIAEALQRHGGRPRAHTHGKGFDGKAIAAWAIQRVHVSEGIFPGWSADEADPGVPEWLDRLIGPGFGVDKDRDELMRSAGFGDVVRENRDESLSTHGDR